MAGSFDNGSEGSNPGYHDPHEPSIQSPGYPDLGMSNLNLSGHYDIEQRRLTNKVNVIDERLNKMDHMMGQLLAEFKNNNKSKEMTVENPEPATVSVPTSTNPSPDSPSSKPTAAILQQPINVNLQELIAAATGTKPARANEPRFKAADIGYFDPHLSEAQYGKGDWVPVGNDIWFRDVHLFISYAKSQANIMGDAFVARHLHLCLRGTAQAWYALLDGLHRAGLQSTVSQWEKQLTQRFKMQASDALILLQADSFSIDDVRQRKSPSDFVQAVARHARDAGLNEMSMQVLWAYNKLAPTLQRDLAMPDKNTTLISFIQQLESKKNAWYAYFSQPLPEKPQQPQQVRQQNQQVSPMNTAAPQYNSYGNRAYRPQPAQQAQQPFRQWHGPSQQRQGYQQYPSQPSQRRIEAPPGPSSPSQQNRNPFVGTSYPAQPNQHPNAYHAGLADKNEQQEADAYFGGAGEAGDGQDEALPPEAYPGHGMQVNFNDSSSDWRKMAAYSCHHCPIPQPFANEPELRDHLLDFHQVDNRGPTAKFARKQWELDQHARDNVYEFKPGSHGYARAEGTVFDTHLKPCIDTGSGASIVDRHLLPQGLNLHTIVRGCKPVTLKGVCGLQIAYEMAHINVRLGNECDGVVDVPVPAYIVDNLACGLIIGLGQLEAMDAHLHLKRKVMEINGTEIKLSYANSAGSDSVGSMHLIATTPTFLVHEERVVKWAALARPAVQFKSN